MQSQGNMSGIVINCSISTIISVKKILLSELLTYAKRDYSLSIIVFIAWESASFCGIFNNIFMAS